MYCDLIIEDEVNIKLSGLDIETRKKCNSKLKFKIPTAFFTPEYKLGRWDGTVSYFSIGGYTYLHMLPYISDIIENAGYKFNIKDLRKNYNFSFKKIDSNYLSNYTWASGHRLEGSPIILEDHQVNIVNSFIDNLNSISEASTGAGKTIVCATLSKIVEQEGRTIVIVPNKDLVYQTEHDYKQIKLDVGVFYGDRKELNKKHTICTWQSLNCFDKKSKDKYKLTEGEIGEFLDGVIAVIVDECHNLRGKALQNLLSGPFSNVPIRWGLTGTVPKEQYHKLIIESMIGKISYTVKAKELQDSGFLSDCHINIKQLVDNNTFTKYPEELTYISSNTHILNFTSNFLKDISKSGNTLMLVDRKVTGKKLQSLIPDSVFIMGDINTEIRQKEYVSMNNDNNKVIIATYGCAAVGLNIPRIFNLILFNPGKSFVRTIQSIGRGLRKASDKDFVHIYDICTTNKYSARHLTERKKFYKEANYKFTISKIYDWGDT